MAKPHNQSLQLPSDPPAGAVASKPSPKRPKRSGNAPKRQARPRTAAGNSLVSGQIVMADMTFFVVSEEKLDRLTEQNDDARSFKAIGAALISFASGVIVAAIYADHLSPFAQWATYLGSPICAVIGGVFFELARRRQSAVGGTLTKIKANPARVSFRSYVEQEKS